MMPEIPEPQLSQWLVDAIGIAGAIIAISILVFIFIVAPLLIAFKIEKNRRDRK